MNFNLELGDSPCPFNMNKKTITDMVPPCEGRKEVDKNHSANMDLNPEHLTLGCPSPLCIVSVSLVFMSLIVWSVSFVADFKFLFYF